MQFKISDRMAALKPSAIREILKATSQPGVIPFAAGNPSPEAFPIKEIENITRIIFADNPINALQYSVSEGHPAFVEASKSFVRSREPGAIHENDDLIICSGATQVVELAAKCLLNEGDVVICEDPSFIGSLNALRSYNARLVGIPLQSDGMDIDALEDALKKNTRVRMLYTIPNFQNPSGCTLSAAKRKRLYELAQRYDFVILEDNPYGDLRFSGEHVPAIKTLDTDGRVIYCGSYSKVIAPGLRVGFCLADRGLLPKIVVAKQCSDVHTNIMTQLICERYLASGGMGTHINNIQKLYANRCAMMVNGLEQAFGDNVSFVRPEGGLFIWCRLPKQVDMLKFCTEAVANTVAVVPGTAFLVDPSQSTPYFRVNFSTPTVKQMESGCEILGGVLRDMMR